MSTISAAYEGHLAQKRKQAAAKRLKTMHDLEAQRAQLEQRRQAQEAARQSGRPAPVSGAQNTKVQTAATLAQTSKIWAKRMAGPSEADQAMRRLRLGMDFRRDGQRYYRRLSDNKVIPIDSSGRVVQSGEEGRLIASVHGRRRKPGTRSSGTGGTRYGM